MYGSIHLKREEEKGRYWFMTSCSSTASFIMLSLCTPPSHPGRELLFLAVQPATHPHVSLTSCVLHSDPNNPLPARFAVTLLHPEMHRDRITHNTWGSEIWQSQIGADEYLLSPIKQLFIPDSLTECSICLLLLVKLMFFFDSHN